MNDLRSSIKSGDFDLQNSITLKGEQAEFYPDSLRSWAERSREKIDFNQSGPLNGIQSPGDLPCVLLPDGSEECHDAPPVDPCLDDPTLDICNIDPPPACAGNPFDNIDLFVSNEIFPNPANPAEIIFLVTTGSSQPIVEIWVGAMAYVNGTQFFGDLHWEYDSDFAAIGVGLFSHPSYTNLLLEGVHQWNDEDCIDEKYSVYHYTRNEVRR